jgi:hypothetical protein
MRFEGSHEGETRRLYSPSAPHAVGYSDERERLMNLTSVSDIVADPDLGALYAYWIRQRGGRPMPRRADINPAKIISLLPQVFIAEIFQPLRFRFRLVGSTICDRWHEDLTGKWLDELGFDELGFDGELESVLEQYASVARTGAPRVDKEEFVNEKSRYLHYRRLLLPLSDEGQIPNMLIGIQKAIGIDAYMAVVPKWM